MKKRDDKSNELSEQIDHLKTKSEDDSTDIKGRLDETKDQIEKLNGVIDAQEAKISKMNASGEIKSAGQQYIEDEGFKAAVTTSKPMSFSMEVKDILNTGNIATGVSRSILTPEHQAGFISPLDIELRIRSLIPTGQTTSNAIRYWSENVFTNNAAMVAEGAAKPQSEITFAEQTIAVQKIAHKFRLSMEVLDDAPMLRSHIDGRGRYGLNLKEEGQLLNGGNTGSDLNGILPQATAYNNATITGYTPATIVDDIRVAKLQARKALLPASGIVMNEEDWAAIELLKDTQGSYLFSSVTSGASRTLWGLPVVTSDSMGVGDWLVGSFALGAQIWDRMGMTVLASTEDGNNFLGKHGYDPV